MNDRPDSELRLRLAPHRAVAIPPDWEDVVRRSQPGRDRRLPRRAGPGWRRRASIAAACFGVLLILSTGAIAVTNVSTGVSAIDELLDRATGSTPDGDDSPARRFVPADAESTSAPYDVLLPDGTTATAVAYRTARDEICTALAAKEPNPSPSATSGGLGCLGGRLLERALEQAPARAIGVASGGEGVLAISGFARSDVEAITARAAGAEASAQMSPTWKPSPATTLRTFHLFLSAQLTDDHLPPQIDLTARLSDGSTRSFSPFGP